MFKLRGGLARALCKEMIPQNRQYRYQLQNNGDFTLPLVKSVCKGLESLRCLGPKIRENLSVETTQTESLLELKLKLKIGIRNVLLSVFAKFICSM